MIANKVLQSLVLGSTVLLGACAGTPDAADRTPSWMKHHVVGTRIPRVPDAKGDASSADYVQTTTQSQLEDLPSVYVQRCRASFQCR
jgi:hypothetical protein